MGEPVTGEERKSFVGVSVGTRDNPARLGEALESAAAEAVKSQLVTPDRTEWFSLSGVEVEIANQHVKTMKATITQGGGGGR